MSPSTCQNCKFYIAHSTDTQGDCRMNPPKLIAYQTSAGNSGTVKTTIQSQWPVVSPFDWCGEWVSKGQVSGY